MKFRKAAENEAQEICGLYRSVIGSPFSTWNEEYPGPADIKADMAAGTLYVLEREREIIGAVSIVPENELDDSECWKVRENAREFARVVIRPEYQGRGYSALLIGGILDELRSCGCSSVHIAAAKKNIPAQRLYRSQGFVFCGGKDMYGNSYFLCEKVLSDQ